MSRITQHPVMGTFELGRPVEFTFDGRILTGHEGEPVAMALKAHGLMIHRYTTRRREPRGVFCAIGRCTDCVMVVDGQHNVRTCVTPLRKGMVVQTQHGVAAAGQGAAA